MSKENDTFIIKGRCRQRTLVCLANSVDYQIWPTGYPVAIKSWNGPGWPGWVASGGASGTTGRSGRPDNALPHGLHKWLERRPFPMSGNRNVRGSKRLWPRNTTSLTGPCGRRRPLEDGRGTAGASLPEKQIPGWHKGVDGVVKTQQLRK